MGATKATASCAWKTAKGLQIGTTANLSMKLEDLVCSVVGATIILDGVAGIVMRESMGGFRAGANVKKWRYEFIFDEPDFLRVIQIGNWLYSLDYETGKGEWEWSPEESSTCGSGVASIPIMGVTGSAATAQRLLEKTRPTSGS